jgi:hypothetical protein
MAYAMLAPMTSWFCNHGRAFPRWRRVVFLCFCLALALPLVGAGTNEFGSLRAAILDLQATFGPKYGRAPEFLTRLADHERVFQQGLQGPQAEAFQRSFAFLRREALVANPLVSGQPILYAARRQYRPDHHNTATFFPTALHEKNDGAFTPGGALKQVDFSQGSEGAVTTLLAAPQGVVRDPEVHFDGRRVVFSLRTNLTDSYHVYEIKADGSGLRQLTVARDVDDLDPLYLPDDSVMFSSTREPKYCMCNRHIMANLYRMDADGANIHQVGKSTLFEGHASLLPDGRVLYDRWEYVDRNFGDAQGLWTANPDGTSHAVYWGNNTASPGAVLDGRALSGGERFLCVFSSCHDRPWGALAIVDRRKGVDGRAPVERIWPPEAMDRVQQNGWQIFDAFASLKIKYEDPYPLSDKYFLCSRMTGQGEEMAICLLDVFGNEILLHTESPGCFDPMPLGPRLRPPVLSPRRDFAAQPGYFYVHNVYDGTHMAGVKPGSVKYLRVVESPEKRTWTHPAWDGQGQEAPAMNWHDFNNKRILGTVPVEADGSVYFELPAERFVYFQLLDEELKMVQSMRSGVMAQSREVAACTGCHENRRTAPALARSATTLAARRSPSRLADWFGPERLFSFRAEVQPVFDRHCVRCHDFQSTAGGGVVLAGDRDLAFNAAYNELWRKQLIRAVGAGPAETQAAFSWGAHASRLTPTLETNHYGVRLSREEKARVYAWMDLNAPYYPSYASAYPDHFAGRAPLDNAQIARLEALVGVPLSKLASHAANRGPQISFDRPELSPCLGRFTAADTASRGEALAIIRAGAVQLAARPEADAEGFVACGMDQWREHKYRERQASEQQRREALRQGYKIYDH